MFSVIVASDIPGTTVVLLTQGKSLIPVTEKLRSEFLIPWLLFTDKGLTDIPKGLSHIYESLSRNSKSAYLDAKFLGVLAFRLQLPGATANNSPTVC